MTMFLNKQKANKTQVAININNKHTQRKPKRVELGDRGVVGVSAGLSLSARAKRGMEKGGNLKLVKGVN